MENRIYDFIGLRLPMGDPYSFTLYQGVVETIYVSTDNKIECIPEDIHKHRNVKNLFIIKNTLKCIPLCIGEIYPLLTHLDLSCNHLESIPLEIGQLEYLEELNVSFNEITSLPSTISNLHSLKILNVSHNQITSIPVELFRLTSIEVFDVSHNRITTLPPQLGDFYNIKSLILNDNPVESIPPELIKLNSLNNLVLPNNGWYRYMERHYEFGVDPVNVLKIRPFTRLPYLLKFWNRVVLNTDFEPFTYDHRYLFHLIPQLDECRMVLKIIFIIFPLLFHLPVELIHMISSEIIQSRFCYLDNIRHQVNGRLLQQLHSARESSRKLLNNYTLGPHL